MPTVKELIGIATTLDIPRRWKMRKAELLNAISSHSNPPTRPITIPSTAAAGGRTRQELRVIASALDIPRRWGMSKRELLSAISAHAPTPAPRTNIPSRPIPAPRTNIPSRPIPAPRTNIPSRPIPAPRTKRTRRMLPTTPPTPPRRTLPATPTRRALPATPARIIRTLPTEPPAPPRANPAPPRRTLPPTPPSEKSTSGLVSWFRTTVLNFAKAASGYLPRNLQQWGGRVLEGMKNVLRPPIVPVEIAPPTSWEMPNQTFGGEQDEVEDEEEERFFGGAGSDYTFGGRSNQTRDIPSFLAHYKGRVLGRLRGRNRPYKVNFSMSCLYKMVRNGIVEVEENMYFHLRFREVLEGTDLESLYDEVSQEFLTRSEEFEGRGSGWIFERVVYLQVKMDDFTPIAGGFFVTLPEKIVKKKAVINIENKDDMCFKHSIARFLNPKKDHAERIDKELGERASELNWTNIDFPADVKKAPQTFEENNPGYKVCIVGYEDANFYPMKSAKKEKENEVIIDLLYYDGHFCPIKSLSRLLGKEYSKNKKKKTVCRNCFNSFTCERILLKHREYCFSNKSSVAKMPRKGDVCKFKSYYKKVKKDFVIYADFEAFNKVLVNPKTRMGGYHEGLRKAVRAKVKEMEDARIGRSVEKESFTLNIQEHVPSGFSLVIVCSDKKVMKTKTITYSKQGEEDVIDVFVRTIDREVKRIYDKFLKRPKAMVFLEEDKEKYKRQKVCHICEGEEGEFIWDQKHKGYLNMRKVRDHCHLTGRFRGAAHSICNLKTRMQREIPIFFHNLQNYDAHLFVRKLASKGEKLDCIPSNEEKYISFSKHVKVDEKEIKTDDEGGTKKIDVVVKAKFLDSYKFLLTSLGKMVETLSPEDFKITSRFIKDKDKLELVKRKGVFPYDYFSSTDVFLEDKLPPIEEFESLLNEKGITQGDYEHAQNVWKTFGMKTFREYHDLYLKTDTLLLADVFERFRGLCLDTYGLDPAHYYTSPGLTWDAFFKRSKAKPELLTDYDMFMMVERGIRGGIVSSVTRYAKANNKYMTDFDPTSRESFLKYLDANNLYGWAMSRKMPYSDFRWLTQEELRNAEDGDICVSILEVDLEVPSELHDFFNDYPLAPEARKIGKVNKLVSTFYEKKNYVLHHETLKYYLEKGLRLKKVHKGFTFVEKAFMKEYIEFNTEMRKKSSTEFEKNFYKLMNNSLFGKTMEKIRNRVNIHLVTNEKDFLKKTKKCNYKDRTFFSDALCAVHMNKMEIYFNKPIYLGMTILELSKLWMYKFFYEYVKKKWGDNVRLLYTDTDSLVLEIFTKDFYEDIRADVESFFDTSNMLSDHPSGLPRMNKKVLGLFKDECGGEEISEFCCARSKLYAYRMDNGGMDFVKCKGVKKEVVRNTIDMNHIKRSVDEGVKQMREMGVIRSKKHNLFSQRLNKVAISADDDKRFILSDGSYKTLALGHWRISD